jgi:hypothetical protein
MIVDQLLTSELAVKKMEFAMEMIYKILKSNQNSRIDFLDNQVRLKEN